MSAMRARSKSRSACGETTGHPFLGAFLRRLGSSHVDVLRALGDLCEHGDTVRKDFDESEGNSEIKLLLADAVPQLADLQAGQQRRVPRQHAEIAFGTGQLHFVHLLGDERAVGRDDLESELGR